MSYAEELKAHYKAVRQRMLANAVEKPVTLVYLPPVKAEPEPGLVPEAQSEAVVKDALAVTFNQKPSLSLEEDLPKLKPLPGLVLNEVGAVRWMRIMHAIAAMHKIDAQDILGTSRKRHIVNARFELFYRMRTDLCMSYMKIGKLVKRDHSTIMHGVWKIRQKLLDGKRQSEDHGCLTATNTYRSEETHPQVTVGG